MLENLKKRTNVFLIIIVSVSIAFILYMQNTLLTNYSQASKLINFKNVENLIQKIDTKVEYIYRISLDFSSLDETYNFINRPNKEYIYKNFRKDSYTLEDLDLSYFLLTDLKNEIKFSKYIRNMKSEKMNDFNTFLINTLKDKKNINGIIKFKNYSYFVSKTPVYKTDYEDKSNGYVILGKKIDNLYLKKITENFNDSKFLNNLEHKNAITTESTYFPIIATSTVMENDDIYSKISFYNEDDNLILSIQTENSIEISSDMFTIVCFLSTFLLLIVLILIFIVNSYRKLFTHNQQNIDTQIDTRTQQMQMALKELEKVNIQLFDIAHTDHLTKTMNRRNFFIHAQNLFSISKRNHRELTVIMIDIDNFKTFNDKYGHDTGDKVLVEFAKVIKRNIKTQDIFGRLGGEEFALVLPNTNLENATKKAEELKEEIAKVEIFVFDNILNITASFGVSDNSNCENIDEMLQKADKLLYSAKNDGRNLVRSRLNTD